MSTDSIKLEIKFPQWISAGKVRNYSLSDPVLDWLSLYGKSQGFTPDSSELSFEEYIMKKGNEFERVIVDELKLRFSEHFKTVDSTAVTPLHSQYSRQAADTLELLWNGTPIVYQGLLYNQADCTFGFPDLLVRSDWINKIFKQPVMSDKKAKKGCIFSSEWHYVVVDIKFTTLKFKAHKTTLLNSGSIPAYKCQTLIYNRALGSIQGLVPGKAYLLGRGWKRGDEGSMDPFDACGRIEFFASDGEYQSITDKAILWIRRVRREGNTWTVFPPSVPELYPNMKNDSDYPWHTAKRLIAERVGEITMVWMCGLNFRQRCHEDRLFSWDDRRFYDYASDMSPRTRDTVSRIVSINRGDTIYTFDKEALRQSLRPLTTGVNLFVDFETVTGVYDVKSAEERIFLVGSGKEEMNEWKFSYWLADKLDADCESKCIDGFVDSVNSESCCRVNLIHYSNAEPRFFKRFQSRFREGVEWIDLLAILHDCKFTIKDCFDFSLKSICKSMVAHGLISTSYEGGETANGAQAMVAAFLAHESGTPMSLDTRISGVVKYNEVDCRVLYEVYKFLCGLIEW